MSAATKGIRYSFEASINIAVPLDKKARRNKPIESEASREIISNLGRSTASI
jgi:hypothetical protein